MSGSPREQARAGLDGEFRGQRLVGQRQPRAHSDPSPAGSPNRADLGSPGPRPDSPRHLTSYPPGAVMTIRLEPSEPGATTSDRPHLDLPGTWTIDPATSIGSLVWRRLGLWTVTGRWHCVGVIHLDELPAVDVIRFWQPSGLPVLTIALTPASLEPGAADLNAMLNGPGVGAGRQRWWTLHSQSLEILPGGAWRVMATLTTPRTLGLVELHLEVDPEQRRDWLVLRGRGVLERRALATGKRAWSLDPMLRLELALHASRVEPQQREP